uniref:Polyprotein n=1 Tax=Peronospora matthiolae TaxID=2874970 RepID=A0AAV1TDT7_9STRA
MCVTIDNSGGYVVDQAEAIGELLREHGLEDANPTKAPIGADCYDVLPDDSALLTETKVQGAPTIKMFQSLVGRLLWIARCTRPDIAFAVHKATRQTHQPRLHDMKLAKRIAQYLKGTRDYKFRMEPVKHLDVKIQLEAYSDADFAAEKSDRKSLTGGIIRLNGMPVGWTSKKQGGVSLSTVEAEFVAASEQARELLGIREMLNEIGKPLALPMVLHVDNQAALKQLAGEASSLKAKHIVVRTKFVCDFARRGIIVSQYVRSEQQVADLLTKALDAVKLAALCEMIGLG